MCIIHKNSKIYLNCSFVSDITSKGSAIDLCPIRRLEFDSRLNLSYSIGYTYKNKYSSEIKYQQRELFNNIGSSSAKYQKVSIVLGYKFLSSQ